MSITNAVRELSQKSGREVIFSPPLAPRGLKCSTWFASKVARLQFSGPYSDDPWQRVMFSVLTKIAKNYLARGKKLPDWCSVVFLLRNKAWYINVGHPVCSYWRQQRSENIAARHGQWIPYKMQSENSEVNKLMCTKLDFSHFTCIFKKHCYNN